jgi:hypothetical protein
MGYVEDGRLASLEFVDLTHAALSKVDIAHRERFVHQEKFGFQVDGDRESQADQHAAGIGLYWLVNEVSDFCEIFDVWEPALDLLSGEAEEGRIKQDILPPAEVRIESRTQFQECGQPAVD